MSHYLDTLIEDQGSETIILPRLCIVVPNLDVGGCETHLCQMVPLLSRDYRIDLFTLVPGNALIKEIKDRSIADNLTLHLAPDLGSKGRKWWNFLRSALRLYRYLLTAPSQNIIHCFLPMAYWVTMVCHFFTRRRSIIVLSRRSLNHYQQRHKILGYLEKFLHRFTTLACGNSTAVLQNLRQEGFDEARLRLIHNGINLTRNSHISSAIERPFPHADFTIMMVANFYSYKGHLDFLQALYHSRHRLPSSWLCVLVGRDKGTLSQVKKMIHDLGLGKNICILQDHPQSINLWDFCDIGVLPSHEEGFSNVILEAMAQGKPVIATTVGGNVDVITHGYDGLLVPPHDPVALGDAIVHLGQHPKLIQEIGSYAKETIGRRFTIGQCLQGYHHLYQDAMKLKLKK